MYTNINSIDMQFSQDDVNREHYKLPPSTKPQTQPMDEEIVRESITTIVKGFEAEAEIIKRQMCSTMKVNGQTESSTDDDRSSNGSAVSYNGKN